MFTACSSNMVFLEVSKVMTTWPRRILLLLMLTLLFYPERSKVTINSQCASYVKFIVKSLNHNHFYHKKEPRSALTTIWYKPYVLLYTLKHKDIVNITIPYTFKDYNSFFSSMGQSWPEPSLCLKVCIYGPRSVTSSKYKFPWSFWFEFYWNHKTFGAQKRLSALWDKVCRHTDEFVISKFEYKSSTKPFPHKAYRVYTHFDRRHWSFENWKVKIPAWVIKWDDK